MSEHLISRFQSEYQDYHRITAERAGQQRQQIRAFLMTLDGPISAVESRHFSAYAGGLMAQNYHVNTVRKKLNMLRSFFGWLYAVGEITGEQYLSLKQVKDPRGATSRSKPNPYTKKAIQDFWAVLDEALPLLPEKGVGGKGSQALKRWKTGKGPWRNVWRHAMRLQVEAMVRLALDLGLRRSEIFQLSVDDLHYDNEYIVIQGKADPNTGEKKVRTVPWTDDARLAIYRWVEFRATMEPVTNSAWLSCWGSGTYTHPMHEDRFNELLPALLGKNLGWRWHRFRHTCATEWLRAGMELAFVSRLLGHSSLTQTLAYAEIVKGDVAKHMSKHQSAFSESVRRVAA
jgi:integrase